MSETVLRTENLSYVYSAGTLIENKAINDINIDIEKEELIGIIGHTGSGKSTLIQHFNALLRPTGGKIFVNDRDIWQDKTKIRQVRLFPVPRISAFRGNR